MCGCDELKQSLGPRSYYYRWRDIGKASSEYVLVQERSQEMFFVRNIFGNVLKTLKNFLRNVLRNGFYNVIGNIENSR